MVAIVSGNGLGLLDSSLATLGGRGVFGSSQMGAAQESSYLNVATGNLVLSHQDELLASLGFDLGITRTYNSLGLATDDNGDNWTVGPVQVVKDTDPAARNTAGASATRTAADGSVQHFSYDTSKSRYVTTDGGGAYDWMVYDATSKQWTWHDGNSDATEVYDGTTTTASMVSSRDAAGNQIDYTYTGGLLTRVRDASGETVDLVYSGNKLVELQASRTGEAGAPLTRIRYSYDAQNRLSRVDTDLDFDGSIADGNSYWVSYTYDGASDRVASVSQKDGSALAITYKLVGADYRVETLTDGEGRVTHFAYDTVALKTTVTDALGLVTVYGYDASNQLVSVQQPSFSGVTSLTTFAYDANGNLTDVVDGEGRHSTMKYNAAGDCYEQTDGQGVTVVRYFSPDTNLLLNETTFPVPGSIGAYPVSAPASAQTVRYVYDAQRNLRFVISATGRLTENRYDAQGRLQTTLTYTAQNYTNIGPYYIFNVGESQLSAWVASLSDKTQVLRTDFSYDFRGQLSGSTAWASVDANGVGIADGQQTATVYVYDSYGQLRQTLVNGKQTATTYDGLGRALVTTNANGQASIVNSYDDANRRTSMTLLNGLVTTSQYDKTGALISVVQTSGSSNLGTTQYWYDADGRLRMTQSPDGRRSYALYDDAGRKTADIDANGTTTEYAYDKSGLLVRTISHDALANVALLVDGSGGPSNVTLAGLALATSAFDRNTWNVYDAGGRLIRTVDAQGALTSISYDGAGRVVSVTRYANLLDTAAIGAVATLANTTPTPDAEHDRTTTTSYDKDGKVTNVVDGEGYTTIYTYDAAGQLIASRLSKNLDGSSSADDQITQTRYDAQGRVIAVLDAEGYLTTSRYDANGLLAGRTRYANRGGTLTTLPVASSEDRTWTYSYDNLNRLSTETDYNGTVTRYTYDSVGNVQAIDRALGTADLRREQTRYDALGRVVAELAPEFAALISDTSTPAQIDSVFAAYATTYTYDVAGRRVSARDPSGHSTYYYYNADGQLSYTVNAAGEVSYRTYNAHNELASITSFTNRLGASVLAALTGGTANAALTSAFGALADASVDNTVSYSYDVDGHLASKTDALDQVAAFSYDAFGEQVQEEQQLGGGDSGYLYTTAVYDRRGLLTQQGQGLDLGAMTFTVRQYDAFGRVTSLQDQNGNVQTTSYDRLGRTVAVKDPLTPARSLTYDAFGQLLTSTDARGITTSYVYKRADRSLTITEAAETAGAVSTTLTYNRFGQKVSFTDGRNNTTSYEYDTAGRIKKVSDGSGVLGTDTYTATGQLFETTDANGTITRYSYDQANRVLTSIVDPNGLALVTQYAYDGQGRQVQVIDSAGKVTRTAFAKDGQVTSVTVDPSGLALTTLFSFDTRGLLLSVTDAAGTTTDYGYDAGGRRTDVYIHSSDPLRSDRFNSDVSYSYDDAGNLLTSSDAIGTTQYIYDSNNRLVFTIDPQGGVVRLDYDEDGNVTKRTAYAAALSASALTAIATNPTISAVSAAVTSSTNDAIESDFYDELGRLKYAVDGSGAVVERSYDGNGNVTRSVAYATRISLPANAKTADITQALLGKADHAHDQVTLQFYDARNRAIASVDGSGAVSTYQYDGAGNLTRSLSYAKAIGSPYGVTDIASLNAQLTGLASSGVDRESRYVYDAAGRLVRSASSQRAVGGQVQWSVTSRILDGMGRAVQTTSYASFLSSAGLTDTTQTGVDAWMRSVATSGADRVERTAYDAAGRAAYTIDATGALIRRLYDADGHVIETLAFSKTVSNAGVQTKAQLDALIAASGYLDATDNRRVRSIYDAGGRLAVQIDAVGAVTQFTYDPVGNLLKTVSYAATAQTSWNTNSDYAHLLRSGFSTWQVANVSSTLNRVQTNTYDGDGRVQYHTDGEGFVTWNDYDALGRVVRTIAYANAVSTVANRSTATSIRTSLGLTGDGVEAAGARVTRSTYGTDGRLKTATDAMGFTESYTYDGVGNKTTFTNKLGAVWSYDYDAEGHVIRQTDPAVNVATVTDDGAGGLAVVRDPVAASPVTTMSYDALGNLKSRTEAAGTASARTVSYDYDAMGRQIRTTYPSVSVYDASSDSLMSNGAGAAATRRETVVANPTSETTYDALGNAVVSKDVGGAYAYKAYDAEGRLRFDVDADGYVTAYDLDSFGEQKAITRYEVGIGTGGRGTQALTLADMTSAVATGAVAAGARRVVTQKFDLRGLLTLVIEPQVLDYDTARKLTSDLLTAGRTTELLYNVFGEVRKQSVYGGDANGARLTAASETYYYYDLKGQQRGVLTRESQSTDVGYFTRQDYDAVGNLVGVTEFAQGVQTPSSGWDSLTMPTTVANADDRYTVYGYDLDNRKTSETRVNVLSAQAGSATATRGNLTTTYEYDKVGNQTSAKDPLGAVTYTQYDAMGRVVAVLAPQSPQGSSSTRQLTQFTLDIYGNVVERRVYATGVDSNATGSSLVVPSRTSADRVTTTKYDVQGRAIAEMDADGSTEYRSYDAAGRLRKEWRSYQDASGQTVTSFRALSYDALGRQIEELTPGSAATLSSSSTPFTAVVNSSAAPTNGSQPYGGAITGWSGTNSATLGFPAIGSNADIRIELTYTTASVGQPGAANYVASTTATRAFVLTGFSGAATGTTLSWTDASGGAGGLTALTGYLISVRNSNGDWVTRYTVDQTRLGDNKGVIQNTAAPLVARRDEYNAFGELTRETLRDKNLDTSVLAPSVKEVDYEYDGAGRLQRTNSGDGVDKVLLHDVDGNVTAEIRSAAGFSGTGAAAVALAANQRSTLTTTETRYDLMGRVIAQVLPSRSTADSLASVVQTGVLTWSLATTGGTTGSGATGYGGSIGGGYSDGGYGSGSVGSYGGSTGGATPIALDVHWGTVERLGSGDVEVRVDYVDAAGVSQTYVQSFRADAALTGARLSWTGSAGVRSITHVEVSKKDVSGNWVAIYSKSASGSPTQQILFSGIPQYNDAGLPLNPQVTLKYRLQGASSWSTATVASGELKNFGDTYLFSPLTALSGTYDYQLSYAGVGETAPSIHDAGSFSVSSPALAVGTSASFADASKPILTWTNPAAGQTQNFAYRLQGTEQWYTLGTAPGFDSGINYGGTVGVDVSGLADGVYDYEVLYYGSGSADPTAHTTGSFTAHKQSAGTVSQTVVQAATQPLTATTSTSRVATWSAPMPTNVSAMFEYASVGGSNWAAVPVTMHEGMFTADLSAVANGDYGFRVTYIDASSGSQVGQSTGSLKVSGSGKTSSVTLTPIGYSVAASTVSVSSVLATEDSGYALFQVALSSPSSTATSVSLSTTAMTASAQDFSQSIEVSTDGGTTWRTSSTVTIAAGQTSVLARVAIVNDNVLENNETFSLYASVLSGSTANSIAVGGATIVDDDQVRHISVADVTANEADGILKFTVKLSAPSLSPIVVQYHTVDGTAKVADGDYVPQNGYLVFEPGATEKVVSVPIDDLVYEGPIAEVMGLVLSDPSAGLADLSRGSATGTIIDNEYYGGPALTVGDTSATEGDYEVFDLSLSNPSAFSTSFNLTLSPGADAYGGSASASDYSPITQVSTDGGLTWVNSTSATFAAGSTSLKVRVATIDDTQFEADERFTLTATLASGTSVTTSASGTATIRDNEVQPSIAVNDVVVNEGNGTATFTITLDHASSVPVTVHYGTADGSALAGKDYTAANGTVTFNPGEVSKTVTVSIINDTVYEGATPETFSLNLASPTNATLAKATGTGSITDDDGVPTINVSGSTVNEGAGTLSFTVSLSNASSAATSVSYTTVDGTAVAGSDYIGASGVLNFAAGETSKTVTVTLVNDNLVESTESFSLKLSSPSGGTLGIGTATATINDDDTYPTISVNDRSVDEAAGTVSFTVSLSKAYGAPVSVNYATANGTAIAGSDYTAVAGTLTFAAGELTKTVTVSITDDTVFEGPTAETFSLNLSGASNATISDATGIASISDNEAYGGPTLSVSSGSWSEGAGYATFDVSLSNLSAFDTGVSFQALAGTASAYGGDFSSATQWSADGGVTWATGSTATIVAGNSGIKVRVALVDDTLVEGNETFTLEADRTFGYTSNANAYGGGTIVDNDTLPQISVSDASVNEHDGTITFTVSLDKAYPNSVTVNYSTADGTAKANSDYTAASGTVTFNPGEVSKTVTVSIINDTVYEGATPETFSLNLASPTNATLAKATGTGSITDDDGVPTINVSGSTVNESAGTLSFTVSLSNASSAATSVSYTTVDGTAVAGSDYIGASGVLNFAAGETSKTVTVTLVNDNLVESTESFSLKLSSPSGGTLGTGTATATINDDDTYPTISVNDRSVDEAAGTVSFTVSLSKAYGAPVSVNYATANGTAIAGSDYTAVAGTLTFAAGELTKTVTVSITDDTVFEGPTAETFSLNLSGASNATISDATGIASISDNEAYGGPTLSVSSGSWSEGAGYATFDVSLSNLSAFDTGVSFQALAGTASAYGGDFSSATQWSADGGVTWATGSTATIVAGNSGIKVRVALVDDTLVEGNETFTLEADRTFGYTSNANAYGGGTIVDNDTLPQISVSDASVNEHDGTITFTVSLDKAYPNPVTVNYSTADGTAKANSDYTAASGTLTFAAGTTSKTVTVSILNDTVYEGATPEIFSLNLTSPTNATLARASATGSITDDDPVPNISVGNITVNENAGTATFTVSMDRASVGAISVSYSTANGTATSGYDYQGVSGTLVFQPGVQSQVVTVSLLDDNLYEGDETFSLNLSNSSGANLSTSSATATIHDNESAPLLSIGDAHVSEASGTMTFVVSLSTPSATTVTVNYATSNGSATAGSDYTGASGMLTFSPGVTQQYVTVNIANDAVYEGAENFYVSLSGGSVGISDSVAVGTIDDDEAQPSFGVYDASASEGVGSLTFRVYLTGASAYSSSVGYTTVAGTAYGGGIDYTNTSGTLYFAAGELYKDVTVAVTKDTAYEANETFSFVLSNNTGAGMYDSTALGTIINDDAYGSKLVVGDGPDDSSYMGTDGTGSTDSSGGTGSGDSSGLPSTSVGGAGVPHTLISLIDAPSLAMRYQTVLQGVAPTGATYATLRYRQVGTTDWTDGDVSIVNGQVTAYLSTALGSMRVEYEIDYMHSEGDSVAFSYAGGEANLGTPDANLDQDRGARTIDTSVAPTAASYVATVGTTAGTVAESLPGAGMTVATILSSSATGANRTITPEIDFKLDRWGNRIQVSDARNSAWVTSYKYDYANRMIEEDQPDANGLAGGPVQRNAYDQDGRLVASTDARGNTQLSYYDLNGLLLKTQQADGGVSTNNYDVLGNLSTSVDAEGRLTSYGYDKAGNLTSKSTGPVEIDTWVPSGNSWVLSSANGQLTESYTYDAMGRRIRTTNAAGETTTSYYDVRGNLIAQEQPMGQTERYAYDVADRKVAEVDANGYLSTWGFDALTGELKTHHDIGGSDTSYTYDQRGLLTSERNGRGVDQQFSYDQAGQLLEIIDKAIGTVTDYAYDAAGRHTEETTRVGATVSTDSNGRYHASGGTTVQDNVIGYDALGRMRYVADDRHIETIEYDAAGNRTRVRTQYTNDDGTQRDYDYYYAYDAMNRQTVVDGVWDAVNQKATIAVDQGRLVSYDKTGNRTSETTYGYQAVAPTVQGGNWTTKAGFTTEVYEYDAAQRLVETTRDGVVTDARHYDAASRVVEEGAELTTGQNRLWNDADLKWGESAQGHTTRYDADGRVVDQRALALDGHLQQEVSNYTYDAEGNLQHYEVRNFEGTAYQINYDAAYLRAEGYLQATLKGSSATFEAGATSYKYDANGYLIEVQDAKDATNNRQFANDAAGRVLEKTSFTKEGSQTLAHRERTLIVNGEVFGTSGDDTTEAGRGGVDGTRTDGAFDLSYTPVGVGYPGNAPSTYAVQAGDSLQSIAKNTYGDSSLWFRIAEANGLSLGTPLTAGQVLTLPAVVGSASNADGVFKPYNAAASIGDTTPTMPAPSSSNGCGALGLIIMVVVAVVVTAATDGAASEMWTDVLGSETAGDVAGAATAAAAGSVASQVVGMATGTVDEFDWGAVATAAVTGGVTEGLGQAGLVPSGTDTLNVMARGAISSAVGQGANMLVGSQKQFSWAALAASAVAAPLAQAAGSAAAAAVGGTFGQAAAGVLGNAIAGITQAETVNVFTGGKRTFAQIAADAFGNVLGQGLLDAAQQPAYGTLQDTSAPVERIAPEDIGELDARESSELEPLPTRPDVTAGPGSRVAVAGDSWARIARQEYGDERYALALAQANGANSTILARGQVVMLPDLAGADLQSGGTFISADGAARTAAQAARAGNSMMWGSGLSSDGVGASFLDGTGYGSFDQARVGMAAQQQAAAMLASANERGGQIAAVALAGEFGVLDSSLPMDIASGYAGPAGSLVGDPLGSAVGLAKSGYNNTIGGLASLAIQGGANLAASDLLMMSPSMSGFDTTSTALGLMDEGRVASQGVLAQPTSPGQEVGMAIGNVSFAMAGAAGAVKGGLGLYGDWKIGNVEGSSLLKQTGAGGPVAPEDAYAAAERTYEQIRADNTDVAKIAQNTGIKPENIQTVKDHVFYDEHLLDRYRDYGVDPVWSRFDADPSMAASWQRLTDGSFTDVDMQLLRHETAEAWYMRQYGPSYLDAHTAADLRYPSPY